MAVREIFNDLETLSCAAAERFVSLAEAAVAARGVFRAAFSGGSTPQRLYEILATDRFGERIDWQSTHIFFGDERMVPWKHQDSNYRMAREALLDHVPIPRDNIHPVDTSLEPDAAARHYAGVLERQLKKDEDGVPQFDLVLLGMGNDGHTASLFPGTRILEEARLPVAAVHVEAVNAWRISITRPLIDHARQVLFLVAGAAKAPVLAEVFAGTRREPPYPVQLIQPRGELVWYLDAAAAQQLPRNASS